jgi:hypothetical protein
MVSGTPSATPDAEPMLERMSLRTTPDSASASGPFEPSPGNGPAVSSGISAHAVSAEVAEVAEVPDVAEVPEVPGPDVPVASPPELSESQAARIAAPAPAASSDSSRRRSNTIPRS